MHIIEEDIMISNQDFWKINNDNLIYVLSKVKTDRTNSEVPL